MDDRKCSAYLSFELSRTNLNICKIGCGQHEVTQVEKIKKQTKKTFIRQKCFVLGFTCASKIYSKVQDTNAKRPFMNLHIDSSTSFAPPSSCNTLYDIAEWGSTFSAQVSDGKCRGQLYGSVHTILKGTHQCHVATKRIIQLACMSSRLGCNAYL